jgi:TatD DNase family protein
MWFDSHCHLHICEEGRPVGDVIADARAAGVDQMLTVGIDMPSNERSLELATEDGVYASVGIHPNSATGWSDTHAASVEGLLGSPHVVAVGETGLDFYRDWAPKADQERAFAAHIELAKRHDKALVIHTRDSLPQTLDVLEKEGPPARFVMHCWSGTSDDLARAAGMGSFVSFAGNVSFKSAEALRDVLPLVPEDRLLIETDSPYLTPVPFRGKPNDPAKVAHVGIAVAETLGRSPEHIAELTTANARRFLALA